MLHSPSRWRWAPRLRDYESIPTPIRRHLVRILALTAVDLNGVLCSQRAPDVYQKSFTYCDNIPSHV